MNFLKGRRGFTLIELMVTVAIIIVALGLMAPTLVEFFKNQKLKNVRAHFASAFNVARLMSITEGSPIRVVFFREGVRVYHVKNQAFRRDEEFIPESAPGSYSGIRINLRFVSYPRSFENTNLIAYRDWEKTQPHLNEIPGPDYPQAGTCTLKDPGGKDLISIEFERDGTVQWMTGDDVPSSYFKRLENPDADIIVEQVGNPQALFLDIRNTGPVRTKLARLGEGAALKPEY